MIDDMINILDKIDIKEREMLKGQLSDAIIT